MKTIGAHEARTHFSELLDRAAFGQRFTITKRGKPMAMLVPFEREARMTPQEAVATLHAVQGRATLGDERLADLITEGRER